VKLILTCYRELLVTDVTKIFWVCLYFLQNLIFENIFKETFV
jgi:hypothetical protein